MDPKDLIENVDKIEKSHTYQSGLKGAVDEAGKALTTVGQAINAVLLPVQGLVWGSERIKDWLVLELSKRFENIPKENIIPPNPHIAGPAIEALKYTAQEDELRKMFTELIGNTLNKETVGNTHPSFVDFIKSMNSNDALVLQPLFNRAPVAVIDIGISAKATPGTLIYIAKNVSLLGVWAGIEDKWASIASIDNLERMGLCRVIKGRFLSGEEIYKEIEEHPDISAIIKTHEEKGFQWKIEKGGVEVTRLGEMFCASCFA